MSIDKERRAAWQAKLERAREKNPERKARFETSSGIEIPALCPTPDPETEAERLGLPGEAPFTRGVQVDGSQPLTLSIGMQHGTSGDRQAGVLGGDDLDAEGDQPRLTKDWPQWSQHSHREPRHPGGDECERPDGVHRVRGDDARGAA
jgi:hypothetical protein